jgi:hypothetical protein
VKIDNHFRKQILTSTTAQESRGIGTPRNWCLARALVTALNIGLDAGMQMAQVPNDKSLKNHILQIDKIVQMSIFFFV